MSDISPRSMTPVPELDVLKELFMHPENYNFIPLQMHWEQATVGRPKYFIPTMQATDKFGTIKPEQDEQELQ